MKTASYWYKKMLDYSNPDLNISYKTWTENVINEARKEAIEECAEKAKLNFEGNGYTFVELDKQSILSLINELK